jgi:hypothetical protein
MGLEYDPDVLGVLACIVACHLAVGKTALVPSNE